MSLNIVSIGSPTLGAFNPNFSTYGSFDIKGIAPNVDFGQAKGASTNLPGAALSSGKLIPSETYIAKNLGNKQYTGRELIAIVQAMAGATGFGPQWIPKFIKDFNLTQVPKEQPQLKIEGVNKNIKPSEAVTEETLKQASQPFQILLNKQNATATPVPVDVSKISPEYEDIASLNLFAVKTPKGKNLTKQGEFIRQLAEKHKEQAAALLYAISGAEGTLRSNKEQKGQKLPGYNVIFGGETISDLSRHPNRLIRSRTGYASNAAGAFQFKLNTYNEVMKKLGLSKFSPEEQNLAALQKVHERTARIGGLPAVLQKLSKQGLTQDVMSQLSPEWASFPTETGRSYYGQPVKSPKELQRFYQQGIDAYRKLSDSFSKNETSRAPVTNPPPVSNSFNKENTDTFKNATSAVQAVNKYKEVIAQNQGPSSPVKFVEGMGIVPNPGATRPGEVRLKPEFQPRKTPGSFVRDA